MTLNLEVGKSYKRGDGAVVTVEHSGHENYPFKGNLGFTYTTEGYMWGDKRQSTYNLIEEVKPETPSPVRTVTRKELVPGIYGALRIDEDGFIVVMPTRDPKEIRDAIANLTLIADALENGDETTS